MRFNFFITYYFAVFQSFLEQEILYKAPTNADERAQIGNACRIGLDLNLPMLIDNLDDEVENKYVAAPIRLFVINSEGKITFACGEGPHLFDPDSWEEAIKKQVSLV